MGLASKFEEEKQEFDALDLGTKQKKVKTWVSKLSEHYDYFNDLKTYIDNHESELDEEFLNAVFQIIINLAGEIEKL